MKPFLLIMGGISSPSPKGSVGVPDLAFVSLEFAVVFLLVSFGVLFLMGVLFLFAPGSIAGNADDC